MYAVIKIITTLSEYDKSLIKRALEHQEGLQLDEVLSGIASGEIIALRGAYSIATINQTEDSLHVGQYGGTLNDLEDLAQTIIKVAGELGKRYITMSGRKGWTKALKVYGMIPTHQDKFTHYRRDSHGWR